MEGFWLQAHHVVLFVISSRLSRHVVWGDGRFQFLVSKCGVAPVGRCAYGVFQSFSEDELHNCFNPRDQRYDWIDTRLLPYRKTKKNKKPMKQKDDRNADSDEGCCAGW